MVDFLETNSSDLGTPNFTFVYPLEFVTTRRSLRTQKIQQKWSFPKGRKEVPLIERKRTSGILFTWTPSSYHPFVIHGVLDGFDGK